jgi:hypothetical protein
LEFDGRLRILKLNPLGWEFGLLQESGGRRRKKEGGPVLKSTGAYVIVVDALSRVCLVHKILLPPVNPSLAAFLRVLSRLQVG